MMTKTVLMTAAALLFCQFAFAGSVSGGGGKSVVCRTSSGALKSVELLDLWEAKTIYGRKILSSKASLDRQINAALDGLKTAVATNGIRVINGSTTLTGAEGFKNILLFDTDRLQKRDLPQIHWLKNVRLKLSDDSFEAATPQKCAIEQTVRYDDTSTGGEIYINQDHFEKMDRTNQAALLIHEAFYAYLRHQGERSSLRVRRTIGLLFANHVFRSLESFLPDEFYLCEDGPSRVVLYLSDEPFKGNIVSQILMADGRAGIDYSTPSQGWEFKSFDDFFNSPYVGNFTNLGTSTSVEYSLNWNVMASTGAMLTMTVTSTPDQQGTSEQRLLHCFITKKADFFK